MKPRKITIRATEIKAVQIVTKEPHDGQYYEVDTVGLPKVGKVYQTWTDEAYLKDTIYLRWDDDPRMVEEGMPGKSSDLYRRHTGWRATTDGVARYAHGVRRCTLAERVEYTRTVHYRVTFGPSEEV
jgi:hypothetical protein